jgi:hypothetical protein
LLLSTTEIEGLFLTAAKLTDILHFPRLNHFTLTSQLRRNYIHFIGEIPKS